MNIVKMQMPFDVYQNWQNSVDILNSFQDAIKNNEIDTPPEWVINLSISEFEERIKIISQETSYNFTLNLIASLEGLFNHQVKMYVFTKPKNGIGKSIRNVFKSSIKKSKTIRFEDILDCIRKADPRLNPEVSKLKTYLQYRHWLAHGRHWAIHYWNIPDPNDVYQLYTVFNNIISFDLT